MVSYSLCGMPLLTVQRTRSLVLSGSKRNNPWFRPVYAGWLQVVYAARRGFYLVLPEPGTKLKSGETAGPLPGAWLPLESRTRSSISATTHELNALNSRLKDASNDCLLLTEQVLAHVCE